MAPAKNHTVEQGECMSSIALQHGFFWQSLWDHADNAALKQSRDSPFVLQPGDVVRIPALTQRKVDAATELRHTFRRKGVPAVLRLQLLEMNEPLANLPYVLEYGGKTITGTTDGQGKLEASLPPNTPQATLRVGEGEDTRVYAIALRTLDPARGVTGIQGRLANLGYYGGPVHGRLDAATIAAIQCFQRDHDLEGTGQADEATAKALSDHHDGTVATSTVQPTPSPG
jgi:Putative peptidoglycan binding domain